MELITDLLGTPSLEDMRHACDGAKSHMLRNRTKPPALSALYTLSALATHEAVHLLCQMLVFDPVSSSSVKLVNALSRPLMGYLTRSDLLIFGIRKENCYLASLQEENYECSSGMLHRISAIMSCCLIEIVSIELDYISSMYIIP